MGGLIVMLHAHFDLFAAARDEMLHEGFEPDFPPQVDQQLAELKRQGQLTAKGDDRDLRALLWSSIEARPARPPC